MFVDMASANPVVFVDHMTALKLLAEQQPAYLNQIVQIVGAVGTVSLVTILSYSINKILTLPKFIMIQEALLTIKRVHKYLQYQVDF